RGGRPRAPAARLQGRLPSDPPLERKTRPRGVDHARKSPLGWGTLHGMALLAQSGPAPQAQGEINTLLGRGSSFDGKLTFEGTVRIDGKISGEIFSNDVLVI